MNIPLKTKISVVVLRVEGFVQGAAQKELISVPFIKRFNKVTLRRSEAAIGDALKRDRRCANKVILETSQISRENTCDGVSS